MKEVKRRKEGIMHPSPLVFLTCRMLHMKIILHVTCSHVFIEFTLSFAFMLSVLSIPHNVKSKSIGAHGSLLDLHAHIHANGDSM